MSLSVILPSNLGPEHEIGTRIPSLITIKTDDTSVVRDPLTGALSSPGPVYDPVAHTLQFPNVNGVAQPPIDLSGLAADIFVDGGTLVGDVLTLTDSDPGTPDIVVDLATLKGVSADTGQIAVNGTDGKPLVTQAIIAAQANCPVTDAFGVVVGNMFQ